MAETRAVLAGRSGPLSSVPFTAMPLHRVSRIDAEPFRVLLLRRLRLPLPLSVRTCRCGCVLDVLGHHRAACGRSGVLGRRVFALESAVFQICRESGARVTTNVMLRRLEVVAEGLTLYGGCQLALDPTLVSPLRGGWRSQAERRRGGRCRLDRGHQGQTYPELCRGDGRARLVVIAGEVGGRCSPKTKDLFWCLSSAKAAHVTRCSYGNARAAWFRRWCCLLACSATKAFAISLMGVKGAPGAGDVVLSVQEVLANAQHET